MNEKPTVRWLTGKRPWWHGTGPYILILLLVMAASLATTNMIRNEYNDKNKELKQDLELLIQRIDQLEHEKETLEEVLQRRIHENGELLKKIEEMENVLEWDARQMVVTHYAPLDPAAVEGMCYSGDPTVTASGMPSEPGISVAAGSNIPFGTTLYIPGYGYREVHDRGGAIGPDNIDVMIWDRDEAFELGRVEKTVYVEVE